MHNTQASSLSAALTEPPAALELVGRLFESVLLAASMLLPQGAHGHKAQASKAAAKAASHHKPLASAAAAGASAMAQCLSDPPPLRPDGRPQRGGRHSTADSTIRSRGTPASASGRQQLRKQRHVCFCVMHPSQHVGQKVAQTQLKSSSSLHPACCHACRCPCSFLCSQHACGACAEARQLPLVTCAAASRV